jgi:FkbM family methyltransferase
LKLIKNLLKTVLPERLLVHVNALDHYLNGEPEIRLMRRVCQANKIALDIGANIGTYTYFLSRYAAKVYAYEPNPGLAERLIRLYPNADVRNAAVSNSEGELTLRIPVKDGSLRHELASVAAEFDDDEVVEHIVAARTIDSEQYEDVGFIKIDAEQHELEVLKGALETIKNSRPIIMTEATPLLYDEDLRTTFRFLTDLDYEGWFTFEGKHYPFSEYLPDVHANREQFGKSFMNTNIFFFPTERSGRDILYYRVPGRNR